MLTGTLGVWKTVSASPNSRNLSALAAHPNAPLLATGTASQVNLSGCPDVSKFWSQTALVLTAGGGETGRTLLWTMHLMVLYLHCPVFWGQAPRIVGLVWMVCCVNEALNRCMHAQVVKLWSALGEQLGVIRATTSLLDSRRPGPVNTLAFHPYQLSLASGGWRYHCQSVQHQDWHCAGQGQLCARALRLSTS